MSTKETKVSGPYESAFDALDNEHRAASLMVKSALANRLMDHIEKHGYNQVEASSTFGVNQSRVSLLVNGRLSKFTIDYLVDMCEEAGIDWEIDREEAYAGSAKV